MAYRESRIGLLLRLDPAKGRAEIATAYRKAKCNLVDTAKLLECGYRSLYRWVSADPLLARELAGIKSQALLEGWHHDHSRQGGHPFARE